MIYFVLSCIIICIISVIYCHFNIKITEYYIKNKKINKSLDGFKILQLSDLHNRVFGKDSKKLIEKINSVNPDIIVITGDLMDKSQRGINNMLVLLQTISAKYPCYYVIGNHELKLGKDKFKYVLEEIQRHNINILNNESVKLNFQTLIYGIGYNLKTNLEKEFEYAYKEEIAKEDIQQEVGKIDDKKFNILLAHNPFSFVSYANAGFDLILAGHVHGGIIRIPLIGGLLSPQRKLFPKYSEGIYYSGKSQMVVSRGLGYGGLKFRLFNTPEIVVVTLKNS